MEDCAHEIKSWFIIRIPAPRVRQSLVPRPLILCNRFFVFKDVFIASSASLPLPRLYWFRVCSCQRLTGMKVKKSVVSHGHNVHRELHKCIFSSDFLVCYCNHTLSHCSKENSKHYFFIPCFLLCQTHLMLTNIRGRCLWVQRTFI